MNTGPLIRLHLFFATENDRAVILRQGPSKQFRMILWHRDTDSFEDGQWLNKKVYTERCALSPDGKHFIFFALDGNWNSDASGAFTALSRPPFWTALSVFPCGDTWSGGGFFLDKTHYYAVGGEDIVGKDDGLARVTFGKREKGCTTGIRLVGGKRAALDRGVTRRILREPAPKDLSEVFARAPAQMSNALDGYDTQGGKLYRRRGMELELIRDFSDMEFEPIRAPYDWRPEDTEPWHPLRDET